MRSAQMEMRQEPPAHLRILRIVLSEVDEVGVFCYFALFVILEYLGIEELVLDWRGNLEGLPGNG